MASKHSPCSQTQALITTDQKQPLLARLMKKSVFHTRQITGCCIFVIMNSEFIQLVINIYIYLLKDTDPSLKLSHKIGTCTVSLVSLCLPHAGIHSTFCMGTSSAILLHSLPSTKTDLSFFPFLRAMRNFCSMDRKNKNAFLWHQKENDPVSYRLLSLSFVPGKLVEMIRKKETFGRCW